MKQFEAKERPPRHAEFSCQRKSLNRELQMPKGLGDIIFFFNLTCIWQSYNHYIRTKSSSRRWPSGKNSSNVSLILHSNISTSTFKLRYFLTAEHVYLKSRTLITIWNTQLLVKLHVFCTLSHWTHLRQWHMKRII